MSDLLILFDLKCICKHFRYIFGCSRIPRKNCDEMKLYPDSRHIVVIRLKHKFSSSNGTLYYYLILCLEKGSILELLH